MFVDFPVKHVQVDEQFIIIESPVEMQFRERFIALNGRIVHLVCQSVFVSRKGREVNQRYGFVHHLAVGIFEDTSVVDREDEFRNAVGVDDLFFERQVSYQAHLITGRRAVAVIFNQGFRKRLLEDHQFVYVSFEAMSAEIHISGDSGYLRCRQIVRQRSVQIQGGRVIGAVDGQHDMMPCSVGTLPVAYGRLLIIVIEYQLSVLQGHA